MKEIVVNFNGFHVGFLSLLNPRIHETPENQQAYAVCTGERQAGRLTGSQRVKGKKKENSPPETVAAEQTNGPHGEAVPAQPNERSRRTLEISPKMATLRSHALEGFAIPFSSSSFSTPQGCAAVRGLLCVREREENKRAGEPGPNRLFFFYFIPSLTAVLSLLHPFLFACSHQSFVREYIL